MRLKLLLSLVFLIGCGKSSEDANVTNESNLCSNFSYNGQWDNRDNNGILTIRDNCTLSDDLCQSQGTYMPASDHATSNQFTVTIVSTDNIVGCLPVGTYQCANGFSGPNYLRITCTNVNGLLEYDRIN